MLFTLAHSPQACDFSALIGLIGQQDALLLMQDGVLAALKDGAASQSLEAATHPVYALCEDLAARGLIGHVLHNITLIDYTGFVALTEKHPQQIAW